MSSIYQQGSDEWLEMRKSRIGASDIPIILGISPYKTALQLWKEKTGRVEAPPPSPHMMRGHEMEPVIRELYKEICDETFLPSVAFHPDHPWLMASLDGINFPGTLIQEIKNCNREVFEACKRGVVVAHYYAQCQTQLACKPLVEALHYVCHNGGEIAYVIVKRDEVFIADLVEKASEFYQCMVNDIAPAASEKDFLFLEGDDVELAGAAYIQAKEELDRAKLKEAACKSALLDLTDDGNCEGGGVRMTRCIRTGVDYKAAAMDAKDYIDLDKYVKKPTVYWKLTIKGES